ncbi:MAG TPA: TIGR02757 family protein [Thermoanaerobaculia bacterium]|nr:TIGR02757 family protein [Thermoanaerobaculia bacterium]
MPKLSSQDALLGEALEALYATYGPDTAASDPILFLRRYERPADQEVVGWIASAFAYGRVETIQANVERILGALGPEPARAIDRITDFTGFTRESLPAFRHRFHGAPEVAVLLFVLSSARAASGSVRAFFEAEFRPEDRDVAGLLSRVVTKIRRFDFRPVLGRGGLPESSPARFFFPDPAAGSACKRWNIYLRWMVRRDRLDLGLWNGIPTDRLVIPTDTHIHLIARRLKLTRRKSCDWRAAREITDRLARFDPRDPVRFDYALCRVGIFGICQARVAKSRCHECLAEEACPVGRRRIESLRDCLMDSSSKRSPSASNESIIQ